MARPTWTIFLAATLAAAIGTANAQPRSSEAAAEAMFDEGRALMKEQRYAEACEKFAQSQAIAPSVGASLNEADCRERLGQVATAWTLFRRAAAAATRARDTRRARTARRRADNLEKMLPYLTITVPPESRVEGLAIHRNGKPVPEALWGERVPLDPGTHDIVAAAPGHEPWTASVELATQKQVVTEVPALPRDPDDRTAGPPRSIDRPIVEKPFDRSTSTRGTGLGGTRIVAIGLAVVGLGASITGAVFGVQARNRWNESRDHCYTGNRCDDTGIALIDDARSSATRANITLAAGLATLTTAAILWLVAPGSGDLRPEATGVQIQSMVSPEATSVLVRGRF